jgi:hypothetical protein
VLAPVAGWLIGRYGAMRVGVVGFLLATGRAEAISVGALWALVIASVIFVLGVATSVPSAIALVGSRGGSSCAGECPASLGSRDEDRRGQQPR